MANERKMLQGLDLQGEQIKDFKVDIVANDDIPDAGSSNEGRVLYNVDKKKLVVSDGSNWIDLNVEIKGDVTIDGGNIEVVSKAITNAKLANMSANTIKGAVSAGSPVDLSVSQVKSMLGITGLEVQDVKVDGVSVVSGEVANINLTEALTNFANTTLKPGLPNGIATLGSDGKVPSSQLPSFVDDVVEYNSKSAFPTSGNAGIIYVAIDTNKTYRWSGSAYVEISASLALGETSSTAYAGNKGKANAEAINELTTKVASNTNAISGKVDKVSGKGLSTNDYTTAEKTKLSGIASGAEVNVQSDWSVTDTTSDAYIKNKPTIPTVNNATLTVKQGGVSLGSFTANASSNKTITVAERANYFKTKPLTGTTGTIAATDHQCGLLPVVQAYLAGEQVMCDIKINSSGDVTWTSSIAMTSASDFRLVIIGM